MGRWSRTDALCNGEERGHREVCGAIPAFLAGLRSLGAGFPEVGKSQHYPTLFSRTIPWEQKAGLLKGKKAQGGEGEGEPTDEPKKKKRKSKK